MQATVYYDMWYPGNAWYALHIVSDDFGHLVAMGYNIFDALFRLRGVLESFGYLVCCNGARLEAWTTMLHKEMSGGRYVYITRDGISLKQSEKVPTIAPFDCSKCVTLSSQLDYHIEWMYSHLEDDVASDDVPRQVIAESSWRAQGVAYKIDGEFDGEKLSPDVFPESVLGAWKLDHNGNIDQPFTPISQMSAPREFDPHWPS